MLSSSNKFELGNIVCIVHELQSASWLVCYSEYAKAGQADHAEFCLVGRENRWRSVYTHQEGGVELFDFKVFSGWFFAFDVEDHDRSLCEA